MTCHGPVTQKQHETVYHEIQFVYWNILNVLNIYLCKFTSHLSCFSSSGLSRLALPRTYAEVNTLLVASHIAEREWGGFFEASSPQAGYEPQSSTWDLPGWWCLSPIWIQSFSPSSRRMAAHWSSPAKSGPCEAKKDLASLKAKRRPPRCSAKSLEWSQVKLEPGLAHIGSHNSPVSCRQRAELCFTHFASPSTQPVAIHKKDRAYGGFPVASSPQRGYTPRSRTCEVPGRWCLSPTCSQSPEPSRWTTATHWSWPGLKTPRCWRKASASSRISKRPPRRAALCLDDSQVRLKLCFCQIGPGVCSDSSTIHRTVRA